MIPGHQFTMRRALVDINAQSGSAKKEAATGALYTAIDALTEHYLDMIDTQDIVIADVTRDVDALVARYKSTALNRGEKDVLLQGFMVKAIVVNILNVIANRKRAEAKTLDVEQWPIRKVVLDPEAEEETAGMDVLSVYKRTGTPYLKKRLAMEKLQAANHVACLRDKCRRLGRSRTTSF